MGILKKIHAASVINPGLDHNELLRMLSEAISGGYVEQIPVMKPHPRAPNRTWYRDKKPDRYILSIHPTISRDGGRRLTRVTVISLILGQRGGETNGSVNQQRASVKIFWVSHLERCWWSIKIQSFKDKSHFLQYAGRYVRRPPIAQRRITWIGERTVRFWFKDKKQHRRVYVQCSQEEFIDRWSLHIPERYQHAVRSFGLFAPRSLGQTAAAIFVILGQKQKPRPKPRPWADSVKRDFGRDPLLDHGGKRMKWTRRLAPKQPR